MGYVVECGAAGRGHAVTNGQLILMATLVVGYFLPALIATIKGRPNKGAIWALNILGGWTVVGWIIAFIWSLTSGRPPAPTIVVNTPAVVPPSKATRPCPSCAESVLLEAKKCKHCGELLAPA